VSYNIGLILTGLRVRQPSVLRGWKPFRRKYSTYFSAVTVTKPKSFVTRRRQVVSRAEADEGLETRPKVMRIRVS
jgi:hypothetical protein